MESVTYSFENVIETPKMPKFRSYRPRIVHGVAAGPRPVFRILFPEKPSGRREGGGNPAASITKILEFSAYRIAAGAFCADLPVYLPAEAANIQK